MKTLIALLVVSAGLLPAAAQEAPKKKANIDIVFCIDRSGSMQQVIDTAKAKVWGIVNEVARAKPTPILRIGLIGYGSADQDIKLFDLTEDLDEVYKNLMTFRTDMGGDEWVGWAISKAHKDMKWSADKTALKIIFMVGNETAKQGTPENMYDKTAPEAIKDGILINTIYCGKPSPDEEAGWREISTLTDGKYSVIDLTGGAVTIATPFDKDLADFNVKINATYIAYGAKGADSAKKQLEQDANSTANGGDANSSQRAQQKCNGTYTNDSWDLVDASKSKEFKLESIKDEDLPEDMRKMTLEERKAHVAKKSAERAALVKQVMDMAEKQRAYIQDEMKKKGLTAETAFDEAVRVTVREQACKKNFTFEK